MVDRGCVQILAISSATISMKKELLPRFFNDVPLISVSLLIILEISVRNYFFFFFHDHEKNP